MNKDNEKEVQRINEEMKKQENQNILKQKELRD